MRQLKKILFVLIMICLSNLLSAQITRTVCASACDYTTIQDAIDAAVIGDNISIQEAVHTEHSIFIDKNVNICGGTPGTIVQATVNGMGNFRIFNIDDNSISVTISDLILQNGNLQSNLVGGAISSAGNLTLVNCTLRNNNAHRGGAIASTGILNIINSTITGNTVADQGMNRASGGAIYAGGTCTVTNSTISGNSNNTSGTGEGGGITILNSGTLILLHATIAYNSISGSGVGAGVSAQSNCSIAMANTIIANNTGAANFNNGSVLPLVENSTNIIPSCTGNCATFITGDPVLLSLADNGGCTLTHDLGVASAAINAGTAFVPPVTFDQRGVARSLTEPDIGAVELSVTVPPCEVSLLCEDILPVEYLGFEAYPKGKTVVLNWETAVEINNEGFAVERSGNSRQWQEIGFVSGSGTSEIPLAYQYVDQRPFSGTNYYRLKQIDYDGRYEYSKVLSAAISTDSADPFRIFPNPASKSLTLQLPDDQLPYQLKLYNSLGQIVWEKTTETDRTHRILFSEFQLSAGTYWLTKMPIGRKTGATETFRVVIQPQARD